MTRSEGERRRRAVVILGMHRSGTSALTRILSLCGATLPQRIMSSNSHNETGYWEPASIVEIHDEILQTAGLSWDDVCTFPHSWFHSDVAKQFEHRLVAAVHEEFAESPFFIIKDPRICRLVPLWLTVLEELNVTPLFVLAIRNPLEVAASLKERDSLPEAQSLLLWLKHFLPSERDTRGLPRSFISYESLLRDWRSVVDKIGHDLSVSWPRLSYGAENEVENFLSRKLQHHTFGLEDISVRREVSEWIKATYAWAANAVNGQTPATGQLDATWASLEIADRSFMPLIVSERTNLQRLSQEVCQLARHSAELRQQNERSQRECEELRQQNERSQQECEELRQQNERSRRVCEELRQQNERCSSEFSGLEGAYDLLQRRLAEHEGRVIELQDRLDTCQKRITERDGLIKQIYASTSWRVTAPLRAVKNSFRRRDGARRLIT